MPRRPKPSPVEVADATPGGNSFGKPDVPTPLRAITPRPAIRRDSPFRSNAKRSRKMVPRGGVEPPTRRFSVVCSTTELPGHPASGIETPRDAGAYKAKRLFLSRPSARSAPPVRRRRGRVEPGRGSKRDPLGTAALHSRRVSWQKPARPVARRVLSRRVGRGRFARPTFPRTLLAFGLGLRTERPLGFAAVAQW